MKPFTLIFWILVNMSNKIDSIPHHFLPPKFVVKLFGEAKFTTQELLNFIKKWIFNRCIKF